MRSLFVKLSKQAIIYDIRLLDIPRNYLFALARFNEIVITPSKVHCAASLIVVINLFNMSRGELEKGISNSSQTETLGLN